jgi:hypothetical protein
MCDVDDYPFYQIVVLVTFAHFFCISIPMPTGRWLSWNFTIYPNILIHRCGNLIHLSSFLVSLGISEFSFT